MSVFSKLKQFKDLRDQGKQLQDALKDESITVDANGGNVSLTMNGSLEISSLTIKPELLSVDKKTKLENAIKEAQNNALKKMQRVVATKMQGMDGFDFPGMK